MKTRTKTYYECEICKNQYRKRKEALECELNCLGLTQDEHWEYRQLLWEEEKAYKFVEHTDNIHSRKRCEDTTRAVVDFQNKHGLASDMRISF